MRWSVLLIAMALHAESGSFTIHMILHAIGEERYEIAAGDGGLTLNSTFEYSDRGMKRSTAVTLRMKSDYTPEGLEVKGGAVRTVTVAGATAAVQEDQNQRSVEAPARYFTIFGPSPFAVQMAMMRYWLAHGKPAELPVLRASASADPIRIEAAGRDSITVDGKAVALDRYTVANLMFGREILWMNHDGQLAAAMTFAGGLPMEALRSEYEAALPQLFRAGVAQEMADLAAIEKQVPPERTGSFAIVGATLVDATGAAPVRDSVVVVRDGRIVAAGPRARVTIPRGVAVIESKGQTLLPGLWEMHTHFSGVEFGPALLGAGITTARDCGGEFEFLTAVRDAIDRHHMPGPRLLLAGLVDASGPKGFGAVTADTPEEARAVVERYHAA